MLHAIRIFFCRRWVIALSAAGLVGCSVHPIPYDVTRVSTADIVEKIRCEAKEGLARVTAKNPKHPILKHTAIGFDFKFDITEENNLKSGELDWHRKGFLPDKLTKWDLAGSATRKRKNERDFLIIEKLEELDKAVCPQNAHHRNWIYPIVGSIGMREVVDTYIRIEELTNLGPDAAKLDKDSIVFSDKLEYTTEFGGSVTPTLELATVAGKFKLTKATVLAEAKRTDVHSVTVALAQDGEVDLPPLTAETQRGRQSQARRRSHAPTGLRLAQRGLEIAGPSAFQSRTGARTVDAAIARSSPAKDRVLAELIRRRVLREDEQLAERLIGLFRRD